MKKENRMNQKVQQKAQILHVKMQRKGNRIMRKTTPKMNTK
jgi:hypothetical protein